MNLQKIRDRINLPEMSVTALKTQLKFLKHHEATVENLESIADGIGKMDEVDTASIDDVKKDVNNDFVFIASFIKEIEKEILRRN